jgi:hypothetical protein
MGQSVTCGAEGGLRPLLKSYLSLVLSNFGLGLELKSGAIEIAEGRNQRLMNHESMMVMNHELAKQLKVAKQRAFHNMTCYRAQTISMSDPSDAFAPWQTTTHTTDLALYLADAESCTSLPISLLEPLHVLRN